MSDLDIADIIKRQIDGHIRQNVSTAIPCVVVNVANLQTNQTIDVTPLIDRVYEDSVVLQSATVLNVPVVFPTGGGGIMSFPITVGDTVLVVYSMRSIEEWMNSDGSNQTPRDNRHHHRTDAVAIPGIYTKSTNLSPHPDNVELKFKDMDLVMKPDNTVVLRSLSSSITMLPNGDINIAASGNVNITGTTVNLN